MRLGLFASLFSATLFIVMTLLPIWRGALPVPSGPSPGTPNTARCFALSYSGARRPDILPNYMQLTTRPIEGTSLYRATGTGDKYRSWAHSSWSFAGKDPVDVSVYHGPTLRFPIQSNAGIGRGLPYLDGTLLPMLLSGFWHPFTVRAVSEPCS